MSYLSTSKATLQDRRVIPSSGGDRGIAACNRRRESSQSARLMLTAELPMSTNYTFGLRQGKQEESQEGGERGGGAEGSLGYMESCSILM